MDPRPQRSVVRRPDVAEFKRWRNYDRHQRYRQEQDNHCERLKPRSTDTPVAASPSGRQSPPSHRRPGDAEEKEGRQGQQ